VDGSSYDRARYPTQVTPDMLRHPSLHAALDSLRRLEDVPPYDRDAYLAAAAHADPYARASAGRLRDRNVVIVGNVPMELTDAHMTEFFTSFGHIRHLEFPPLPRGSRVGQCVITFLDTAAAAAAAAALRTGPAIAGYRVTLAESLEAL
jgi:hypothetical protein